MFCDNKSELGFRKLCSVLVVGASAAMMAGYAGTALSATPAGTTSESAAHSSAGSLSVSMDGYKGAESSLPRAYAQPKAGALKSFTIGFMNPSGGNQNLQAVQDGAQAETERLGGKFIAKNDEVDVNKQLNNFNQLVVQGANAILLYPLDPKALGPVIAKAKEKGIVVIGYDVTNTADEPLPTGYTSQVMQGRDWQAWAMSKAMSVAQPEGQVGLIGFAVPVPGIKYLMDRVKYWAGTMGLKILGQQDNQEDAAAGGMTAAAALLGAYPKLDGIIAYNDPSAEGAAAAARTAKRTISIVGMNGDNYGIHGVERGSITATFQNDAIGQGVQGVIGAYNALSGLEIPKTIVRPPLTAITKSNVGSVTSWDQQLAKLKAK